MEEKYLEDLVAIKKMMSKSSQFISLSGLTGVLAGVYALVGAYFANKNIHDYTIDIINLKFKLIYIGSFVLILSVITAFVLTLMKAKQQEVSIWTATSRRMLFHFLVPLFSGGFLVLVMLNSENYEFIAPITLIFYALSCINASKYTFRDVLYLGLTMLLLGLLSSLFIGYGLLFWTIGFGFCHILYGSIMYVKYDLKNK